MARYGSAISKLVQAACDPQFDAERIYLLNQARQNLMKIRGQHFGVPGLVTTEYGDLTDYVPFTGLGDAGEETGASIRLCPPINFIGGDCWKYTSVLGKDAPHVKAIADDLESGESTTSARDADAVLRDSWRKTKLDRLWRGVAFHQYATGPAFIRTYWATDAKKYGQSVEPQIEVQMNPEGVPMPVVVGQQAYANGDAEIDINSVLEVSVPWHAKTIEECDFLKKEVMRSKWKLLERYPKKLDQYRDSAPPDTDLTGATTTALEVQDASQTPSGVGRTKKPHDWRHMELWVQPHYFQAISEADVRAIFEKQFPDGLYVSRVGSVTCEIDNRAVVDEWSVCKVGHQLLINDRPLCADFVPLQNVINDLGGMAIETVLRAITQTIMDNQLIDREAWSTKEAIPAEVILTTLPVDGDIGKRIYQIPPARLGDQVLPLLNLVRAWTQDIIGIRPELTGGGEPTQTWREAKQRKDQALLQLAPQSDAMRYAAEDVGEKLVKLRAKFGSGTIRSQRQGSYGLETDIVDLAALQESGWHTESDDNFPMTLADTRDGLAELLKDFPPEVQQALSILDPMNIEAIYELLQLPGFQSAVREQVEKTLGDIQQLLEAQPIPGAPGPDGQPGPPQSSIPPDSYDNHIIVAGVVAKWLVSKTGQKAKHAQPGGFANIEAFQAAHQALTIPPPTPPPPPLKSALNFTAKLEDFPQLTAELLIGAGLPAPAPDAGGNAPAPPAPAPPAPAAAPQTAPDLGAPQGVGLPLTQQQGPAPPLPIQ